MSTRHSKITVLKHQKILERTLQLELGLANIEGSQRLGQLESSFRYRTYRILVLKCMNEWWNLPSDSQRQPVELRYHDRRNEPPANWLCAN